MALDLYLLYWMVDASFEKLERCGSRGVNKDGLEHSRSSSPSPSPPPEDGHAMRRRDLATSGRLQRTTPEAPAPRDLVPMMPLHSMLELNLPRSYATGRETKMSN